MKTRLPPVLVFLAVLSAGQAGDFTSLRIEQTVDPQFPAALAFSPVSKGEANLVINVDADGKLVDWLVVSYTDKAFADEAVSALREWRYQPATQNGEPVGVRLELRVNFSATGRVVSLTTTEVAEALVQSFIPPRLVSRISNARDLDRPIIAVQTVSPWHPGRAKQVPQPAGTVLVDFYVDEAGLPRMPVVIDSTHDAYAQAAVGALSRWRFTAPTRHGTPVAVRVQQRFNFSAGS